jgi:hypothetical protein
MTLRIVIAAVIAFGLAAAGWFLRGSAPVAGAARALGMPVESATPPTLQAAGVHKCVGVGGTRYIDSACPKGTREAVASGGTMTVTAFPKAARPPTAVASGVLGGPLVQGMDPDARDRLRDKAIEAAANR